jgi:hypothetical protein
VKWNSVSSIWYCSDDSLGINTTGDIDAVNTLDMYIEGGQTSGTVNLTINEAQLNTTIDSRILLNNNSITNTLNLYVLISTLVDRVGNWTLDKINYYTKTEVNAINTSMKNYVDYINSTNLQLAGGTMAGNLNLSENINLTMNGGTQISSNITCVKIKGSTVTMLVC